MLHTGSRQDGPTALLFHDLPGRLRRSSQGCWQILAQLVFVCVDDNNPPGAEISLEVQDVDRLNLEEGFIIDP